MLTFLSRSFRQLVDSAVRRAPQRHLRALPTPGDFQREARRFSALSTRAHLRVAGQQADPDTAVAVQIGATAFVAGHGARIYSLDAFRPRDPHHPRAA